MKIENLKIGNTYYISQNKVKGVYTSYTQGKLVEIISKNKVLNSVLDLEYFDGIKSDFDNLVSFGEEISQQIAENSKLTASDYYNNYAAQREDILRAVDESNVGTIRIAETTMGKMLNGEIMTKLSELVPEWVGRTWESLSAVEVESVRRNLELSGDEYVYAAFQGLTSEAKSTLSEISSLRSQRLSASRSGGSDSSGSGGNEFQDKVNKELDNFDDRIADVKEKLSEAYDAPIYDKETIDNLVNEYKAIEEERKNYVEGIKDNASLDESTLETIEEILEDPFDGSDDAKKEAFLFDVDEELASYEDKSEELREALNKIYEAHEYDSEEANRIIGEINQNENDKLAYLNSVKDSELMDRSTYDTVIDAIDKVSENISDTAKENFNFEFDEAVAEFDDEAEHISEALDELYEAHEFDYEKADKLVEDYRTNEKNRAAYLKSVVDNELLDKDGYEQAMEALEDSDDNINDFAKEVFNYGVDERLSEYEKEAERISEGLEAALADETFNGDDAKKLAEEYKANENAKLEYLKSIVDNELIDKDTRETVLEAIKESTKNVEEIDETLKDGFNSQISYLFEQYERYIEDETDALEKQADAYDFLIDKAEALVDAEERMYDAQADVRQAQKDIAKELATNKALAEYLDKDTRRFLFNDSDYNKLSSKLKGIASDIGEINAWYNKQINNLTEETWYLEESITKEYERRLAAKEQEYEIARKEIDLEKKRMELNNILNEKNIRMLVENDKGEYEWTYVHDYEEASKVVGEISDIQSELAESQRQAAEDAKIAKEQADIYTLKAEQDAINNRVKLINEETEKMAKVIENITDPLMDFGAVVAKLNILVGGSLDGSIKEVDRLRLGVDKPTVSNNGQSALLDLYEMASLAMAEIEKSGNSFYKDYLEKCKSTVPSIFKPIGVSGFTQTITTNKNETQTNNSENMVFNGDIIINKAVDTVDTIIEQVRAFKHNAYKKV